MAPPVNLETAPNPAARVPEADPPPTPDATGPPDAVLSASQLASLEAAALRAKKIRRAAAMATFNTWTIGIFAVPALLVGLFSLPSLLVGAGLGIVAWYEHRGAVMFRRLDDRAPRLLGFNQLGLAVVLIAYGAWGINHAVNAPNHYAEQISAMPQLAPTLEPLGKMYVLISVLVYGGVIVLSVIFQGLNAWYYFSRAKCMRAYFSETPAWVVQMQRAAALH